MREPDLDPTLPLKAAQARRQRVTDQRRREKAQAQYARQVGHLADCLVHLLHQAKLGTPKLILIPQYVPTRQVFQAAPRKPVRDWRSLPLPVLPRPVPAKPQPVPTLYGTQYRSAR